MTRDDKDIVSILREATIGMVGQDVFDLNFGSTARWEFSQGVLRLVASTRFALERLRSHLPTLRKALESATGRLQLGEVKVEAVFDAATPPQTAPIEAATAPETSVRSAKRNRRPRAKLSDFIVGDCNRVAHAAVNNLLSQQLSHGPVYLYGPSGTGKTHMLEAIVGEALRKGWQRVVCLSAEEFTSQFLGALHGSGLPVFRRKYRDADLLLLDDVQFFLGKRATITEFQHTLDSISRTGRRLVVTADQSPADLHGLGAEIAARLAGGMVCPIEPASATVREQLARSFAKRIKTKLTPEVVAYLVQQIPGDARQLQGAVNRLSVAGAAFQRTITVEFAKEQLADLLQTQRVVKLPDIERVVCDLFGVERESLQSDCRKKSVSHPRMLAMWLARKFTRAAYAEIGDYFGQRTHSTVISANHKVDQLLSGNGQIQVPFGSLPVADAVRRAESRLGAG